MTDRFPCHADPISCSYDTKSVGARARTAQRDTSAPPRRRTTAADREASIADLARETGSDPGNLHAEVQRLVKAGILADRRAGRTRLLRAGDSALIGPLANLLLLGYGPKRAVEEALSGISGVEQAFIGGSWAARYHGQAGAFPLDVDVIVVGRPNRDEVTESVVEALRGVGHDGQVIFRTPTAWRQATDAFTRTAKNQPLVALTLGDLHG